MSEENENITEGEGIKNLRKQYESTQKDLAAANERLATFEAKERQSSVAAVLKAKGLPEKVAALYVGADFSEDAVGKWAAEYADVFGVQQQNQSQEDANAQQAERVANAAFGTENTNQNISEGQKVLGDPAEILHAIQTLPYDELVKLGYMPNTKGTLYDNHGTGR